MDTGMVQRIVQQPKLILTSQMLQSLEILEMPLFELQQVISEELVRNPLLEILPEETDPDEQGFSNSIADDRHLTEGLGRIKDDYLNSINNDHNYQDPLNFITTGKTLKDYLFEQALELNEDGAIINICNYVIENIDEKGYLGCTTQEMADELRVSLSQVNYALKIVQGFQPWGVAARDLKECLKIQLMKKQIADERVYLIVDECLELLADNKVKDIAKKLKVGLKKAQEYCNIIRNLEPKPARGFYTDERVNFVIPEAQIIKVENNWFILMNESALPQLTINQLYRDIIKRQENKQALDYVRDKLKTAVCFIKNIEYRKRTIFNILAKIMELQKEYFERGEDYLRPMTINDIAAALNLNASTVSRAIREKYINTPFNTVKLKKLFTVGIEADLSQERISSKLIKKEIRKLIDHEDKTQPLSDQALCNRLRKSKIMISRRTVAKYREEMEIRSSDKRRTY